MKIEQENQNFKQIFAGQNHSIAVSKQGRVYTWGYAGYGVLGRKGLENIPIKIETGFSNNNRVSYLVIPPKQVGYFEDSTSKSLGN